MDDRDHAVPVAEGDDTPTRHEHLEAKLRAKDRTIAALMRRVEGTVSNRSSSFLVFEQNLSLEKIVAQKTSELREQGQRLEATLGELRRTESQLLQAQKLEAIGALAAGVAHEINTPTQYVSDNTTFLTRAFEHLASVALAAQALLDDAGSCAAATETFAPLAKATKKARLDFTLKQVPRALAQSVEGLQRIASIVGAMKEFSHPSTGEKEAVNIAHAIETTLTVARSEWKYVAEVRTVFDPDLPDVPLLRDKMNQVFLNLIVNAAHAIGDVTENGTKGKGTICIETKREGDYAVVMVSDSGTGIPETVRNRIFDPFFTTKPVGKGTGQGLAIAYDVVVEKHGGRIDVQSEVGRGTTFEVRIPLAVIRARTIAPRG